MLLTLVGWVGGWPLLQGLVDLVHLTLWLHAAQTTAEGGGGSCRNNGAKSISEL